MPKNQKKHEREETLTSEPPPRPDSSKRQKRLTVISSPTASNAFREKGKSKIEEEEHEKVEEGDQEMDTCGICLSEEGKPKNQKNDEREETLASEPFPSPDSTKHLKTLNLISSPNSSNTVREKGKSKIEEEEHEEHKEVEEGDREMDMCGICLSEEGKAIRGQVDSCDHYFCFVCIMEWAKLETRCPICKRRFGSICRLPKEGVLARERIVQVPVRDQVRS